MVLFGHVVRNTLQKGPEHMQQHVTKVLDRRLDLRDDQQEVVERAVGQAMSEAYALHDDIHPRMRSITSNAVAEIRTCLDEEQQARLAAMVARWEKRHRDGR
jgi:hypothetical protein